LAPLIIQTSSIEGRKPHAAWMGLVGERSASSGATVSSGSANGSTRFNRVLLRSSRVTSGRE
jgi:hypothetical protein